MTRKRIYYASVRIEVRAHSGDVGSFLDMMRYDVCRVRSWDSDSSDGLHPAFIVSLASDRPFTISRWQSFGLHLTSMSDGLV